MAATHLPVQQTSRTSREDRALARESARPVTVGWDVVLTEGEGIRPRRRRCTEAIVSRDHYHFDEHAFSRTLESAFESKGMQLSIRHAAEGTAS